MGDRGFHGFQSRTSADDRSRPVMVRDEEFEEEEIWAIVRGREDLSPRQRKQKVFTSQRAIPESNRNSAKGKAHDSSSLLTQSSTPMNIPDWSKIYGKGNGLLVEGSDCYDADDEDDNNCEADILPPHQWLAKKLARSQISSSMCEGIGRTLKGRDLSKVRNAVLSKTGYLE